MNVHFFCKFSCNFINFSFLRVCKRHINVEWRIFTFLKRLFVLHVFRCSCNYQFSSLEADNRVCSNWNIILNFSGPFFIFGHIFTKMKWSSFLVCKYNLCRSNVNFSKCQRRLRFHLNREISRQQHLYKQYDSMFILFRVSPLCCEDGNISLYVSWCTFVPQKIFGRLVWARVKKKRYKSRILNIQCMY